MELFLQLGWGMMDHTRHLLDRWNGGTAILSPRDLEDKQLRKLSEDIRERSGRVLLDPQFYLPHSEHHRLSKHSYWPSDYASQDFWEGEHTTLVEDLVELNRELATDALILPGIFTPTLTQEWLNRIERTLTAVGIVGGNDFRTYATVAIGTDLIADKDEIHRLLDEMSQWSVDGIYLLADHPDNEYMVSNPTWLGNLIDLVAGIRLRDLKVIIGYSNQQFLITGIAGPTALASGTFQNVRSFPPDKFDDQDKTPRQRSVWYYSPPALSEYQIAFLDVAFDEGVLSHLRPNGECGRDYSESLFEGVQPSAVDLNERESFRHFLNCFHDQVGGVVRNTFEETVDHIEEMIDAAYGRVRELNAVGVFGGSREFSEGCYNASRSAILRTVANRGPVLKRKWSEVLGA